MPKKKRTLQQNRIIHALLNKFNFTADDKAEMVFDITRGRSESTKEMYESEADVMIKRLGGTQPVSRSRRTENHHNQEAGIPTVPSARSRKFLNDLWLKYPHRNDGGWTAICRKMFGHDKPHTAREMSAVIEAVKSMNERENAKENRRAA